MKEQYVYNITTKVATAIHEDWLIWAMNTYIPGILATGCFIHHRVLLLKEVDDSEGPTYAIQFTAIDFEQIGHFRSNFLSGFTEAAFGRWGDQFISFTTIMQIVN